MALDVYREIPSVLISTALGLRPRAVLISTSGIFPVYRLKPCVNLYLFAAVMFSLPQKISRSLLHALVIMHAPIGHRQRVLKQEHMKQACYNE